MKKKLLSLLLLVCVSFSAFAGCEALGLGSSSEIESSNSSSASQNATSSSVEEIEEIDYAGSVSLDMSSETQKLEVEVKLFIDGDTTHFYLPTGANVDKTTDGVLKARYLAINTPESTGKIEKWGKQASNYTRAALESAESIIVETDGATWEVDSTGSRHLVWVWYKPQGASEYRNLNIEILQQGLAIASNSAQNRYGSICMSAIAQAKALKLHVYSKEKDPLFYEGNAIELDLKELRLNIAQYEGISVAFEGVVAYNSSEDGVYVESYDEETDVCYGMYVYYGATASGDIIEILSVGNKVRIVGTVSYWEAGGTYQVAGLSYRAMRPNDPSNTILLDPDNKYDPAHVETTVDTFFGKKTVDITVEGENEEPVTESKEFDYAALAIHSSISMKGLKVKSIYTTPSGDSKGAMTLTCEVDGKEITVRTIVLLDENGDVVTKDRFLNKTIDVQGIIDYYKPTGSDKGTYQIKALTLNDITIR